MRRCTRVPSMAGTDWRNSHRGPSCGQLAFCVHRHLIARGRQRRTRGTPQGRCEELSRECRRGLLDAGRGRTPAARGTTTADRKFIRHGWRPVLETRRHWTADKIMRKYTWGLDLSWSCGDRFSKPVKPRRRRRHRRSSSPRSTTQGHRHNQRRTRSTSTFTTHDRHKPRPVKSLGGNVGQTLRLSRKTLAVPRSFRRTTSLAMAHFCCVPLPIWCQPTKMQ